jgi:hypothetical protein
MNTSTEASPFDLAERRAARLAMVLEGYEVGDEGMPDSSVPGAARVERTAQRYPCDVEAGKLVKHPRYVLLTQYGDKGNYRAYLANDVANVAQLARLAVCDGESIVVYFDLDELAGPEPEPTAVMYSGTEWDVAGVDEDTGKYNLERDGEFADAYIDACTPIDIEDERMPVRYGLAKVVVSVVFNTVPLP